MSSHWRSSRWSSAREREEQVRVRDEEKTQTRRGTAKVDPATKAKADSRTEPKPATELSDLITSSARKPRERKWPHPDEKPAAVPTPTVATRSTRGRSRRRATPTTSATVGGPSLPNLPDEPTVVGSRGRGGSPNRPLIFGLLLFVAMGVIAFNPGDIFPSLSGDDPEPTATMPSMIVPTAVNTQQPDETDAAATEVGPTTGEQTTTRPEIICLDAGHGGWDPGFVRDANERAPFMEEADLNLAMSYMLKDRLEAEGFTVVLTRETGTAVNTFNEDVNGDGKVASDVQRDADDVDGNRDELQARINVCNDADADILVSLHINGFGDTTVRGYEVLYTAERDFGQQNGDLAFDIYSEMTVAFEEVGFVTDPRGAKPDTSLEDTAMHEGRGETHFIMIGPAVNASDYAIVPSEMPGVICEAGFISNDADAAFLADPDNQLVIVNAYADGILNYFDRYPGTFQR